MATATAVSVTKLSTVGISLGHLAISGQKRLLVIGDRGSPHVAVFGHGVDCAREHASLLVELVYRLVHLAHGIDRRIGQRDEE